MKKKSFFITFEGGEGSGKSTVISMLSEEFRKKNIKHILTREPGGTVISDKIRAILLDPENKKMAPMTELFLYEAARAQHVKEKIESSLNKGVSVLCDRFTDSTVAYQSAGRNLNKKLINTLNDIATQGITPDLTIILDINPKVGIARATKATNKKELRFEKEKLAFHNKVRKSFLEMAKKHPKRYLVINTEKTIPEVFKELEKALTKKGIL